MDFPTVVRNIARTAGVAHAQNAIRAAQGKDAAKWLADHEGISRRTARRWMSAKAPASRGSNIITAAGVLAGATGLAAQVLRTATGIDVGTVEVEYDGESQGTRSVGYNDVSDDMLGYLDTAARDLENHDLESAADAFSSAVMHGYEPGLEDTLYVSDYTSGIDIR